VMTDTNVRFGRRYFRARNRENGSLIFRFQVSGFRFQYEAQRLTPDTRHLKPI
jgi:hypothetical protein